MNDNNIVRIGGLFGEDDVKEALDYLIDSLKEDGVDSYTGFLLVIQDRSGTGASVFKTYRNISLLGILEKIKADIIYDD